VAAYGFAAAIMGGDLVLFHSLSVRVSENDIVLTFGVGLIGKSFVVSDIQSAAIVRNRWYYGWGIKRIPGGWVYNVSGFDAVEIQLNDGRNYRIGTDEPEKLHAAIESVIGSSRESTAQLGSTAMNERRGRSSRVQIRRWRSSET